MYGEGKREDMTIHLISHAVVLHARPKLSSPSRVAFESLIHFNELFCSNGNISCFFFFVTDTFCVDSIT